MRPPSNAVPEPGTGQGTTALEWDPDTTVASGLERISVAFVTMLRQLGVKVPVSAALNFFEAMGRIGLDQRDHVYTGAMEHPQNVTGR